MSFPLAPVSSAILATRPLVLLRWLPLDSSPARCSVTQGRSILQRIQGSSGKLYPESKETLEMKELKWGEGRWPGVWIMLMRLWQKQIEDYFCSPTFPSPLAIRQVQKISSGQWHVGGYNRIIFRQRYSKAHANFASFSLPLAEHLRKLHAWDGAAPSVGVSGWLCGRCSMNNSESQVLPHLTMVHFQVMILQISTCRGHVSSPPEPHSTQVEDSLKPP